MMRTLILLVGVCVALLVLPGCVAVAEETGTKTFTYDGLLLASLLLGGLVGAAVGWKFRQSRAGGALVVISLPVVLLVAPSFYFVQGTVTQDGFRVTDGFWGSTTVEAEFAEITRFQLTARGRDNGHFWTYSRGEKEDVELSIGNRVTAQTGEEIAARLNAMGVQRDKDIQDPQL